MNLLCQLKSIFAKRFGVRIWALSGLLALALLGPAAAHAATNKLDLQVRNIDGTDECAGGNGFHIEFRIVNNDSVAVDLATLKVSFWFNNSTLVSFVNQNWTTVNGGSAQMATVSGPTSMGPCGSSPRLANQRVDQTFTSVSIPPAGIVLGQIWYWRGGAAPFDVGCNDFSRVPADTVFHQDPYFALYQSNVLVCEYSNSSTIDINSGMDPCSGANNCATPTFTPSPTRTVTPTPTPQMSLVKSSPSSVVTLGDTLTFCIHWINDSNGTVTRVIRDVVPPSMTYLGADNGGSLSSGRVTWSIPGAVAGSNGDVCFWGRVTGVP